MVGVFGFSQSAFRTTLSTLVQSIIPDNLRSRVTSLRSYGQGFVVATSLGVGWLADQTSAALAITVMGGCGLALTLVCLFALRRVRALD